jgi:hypothetical protein
MKGAGAIGTLGARGLFSVVFLVLFPALPLQAQNRLTKAQAREDLRYLFSVLEETHPDPFSAFGGRVNFMARAAALLEAVPETGMTAAELYDIVRPLFGDLGDGHTYINAPLRTSSSGPARRLPVRFGIAMDAVFVESAFPPHDELIGYRVLGVQGVPIQQAAQSAANVFPAENRFGAIRWLLRFLGSDRGARRVFPEVRDSLRLDLAGPDGERLETYLPFSLRAGGSRAAGWVSSSWELIEDGLGPFHWQILGDANVGYLRVSSIQGREAFEELKAVGRKDLSEQLASYYERFVSDSMPATLDEALEGVPCFTHAVRDVLTSMRDMGSDHLILDLRGNGGGWSSLITPFLILAYGDRYLGYDYPVRFATRISPSYLELNGLTLSQLNAQLGSDFELGEFRFAEEESIASRMSIDEYANEVVPYACGLADLIRSLKGAPIYSPTLYVLVDPATFSAAYHFVYRVWHLGAKVVGVPSSQAGNAFVDVTPFDLPNSKLRGSIARTAQTLFPGAEGRVMIPDFPMTWREFAAYRFDEHAEVRFGLDVIRRGH